MASRNGVDMSVCATKQKHSSGWASVRLCIVICCDHHPRRALLTVVAEPEPLPWPLPFCPLRSQVHKGGILKQAVFNWAHGRKLHFLNQGWRFDRVRGLYMQGSGVGLSV